MPLHICHITTVHPIFDNRIFYKECLTLKAAGHKVSIMASGVDSGEKDGINIIGLTKYSNRREHFFKTSISGAYKAAKELDADVYHFHDPELMVLGLLLKLNGKKVVYDIHENNPAAIMSKPYLNGAFKRKLISVLMDSFERFSSLFYDAIVTAREDISQRFVKRKPVLLRNFPILPDYDSIQSADIDKKHPAIIHVGGLSPIRGIKELITAFENLDAELWLLGPFESEAFKKECEQLKGWGKVNYLGTVGPQEIFSYIKAADIGIVNFLPVPNHVTTLATKPFEYMACGLPMVMSDFPYWRGFFKDSSLYANPADSQEIANTIKGLLANEELKTKMAAQNLRLAREEYNWAKESEKLIELYRELQ